MSSETLLFPFLLFAGCWLPPCSKKSEGVVLERRGPGGRKDKEKGGKKGIITTTMNKVAVLVPEGHEWFGWLVGWLVDWLVGQERRKDLVCRIKKGKEKE